MCELRRNSRCRGTKHYGKYCTIVRPIYCRAAADKRRQDAALLELARAEEEVQRSLGIEGMVRQTEIR